MNIQLQKDVENLKTEAVGDKTNLDLRCFGLKQVSHGEPVANCLSGHLH